MKIDQSYFIALGIAALAALFQTIIERKVKYDQQNNQKSDKAPSEQTRKG